MADTTPVRTPWRRRLEDLSGTPLHVTVWTVAALVAVALLVQRGRSIEYVGIARALEYEISAPSAGRIAAVLVDVYAPVEAGQGVARLDDAAVRAQIETERRTLARTQAELEAAHVELGYREADLAEELRRFQIDEQGLWLDVLEQRVAVETDQVELERLELEQERTARLAEAGVVGQAEADDARLRRQLVARRLEENRQRLARTESEHAAARERRLAFAARYPALDEVGRAVAPLREAIHVQQLRIAELELELRALTLRSPVHGRVTQVLARRGQAVVPGEPIVAVAETTASEILAYAAKDGAGPIAERQRVVAARRSDPTRAAESIITRVGPAIEAVPQRLWADPSVPQYARPFVVAGVPGLELTPGELVTVTVVER